MFLTSTILLLKAGGNFGQLEKYLRHEINIMMNKTYSDENISEETLGCHFSRENIHFVSEMQI